MKKILVGIIGISLSTGFLFWNAQPDGLLHVYFLDVGQGDAILLRTPNGHNILVDGGPGNAVLKELNETLPFFDTTLDYIILTHPDRDHIEGLIYVLKRYPVRNVFFTGITPKKPSYLLKSFLAQIKEKNIPVTLANDSSDIALNDNILIDILFPLKPAIGGMQDTNNASVIAKVIYGNEAILLTGDSETLEEEMLLQTGSYLTSTVLKVGHHGSHTSTTQNFLNAVSPLHAVISVGKGNSYNHPHPSVIKRLKEASIEIHRTDTDGRIEFVLSKEKIQSIRTISAPRLLNFLSNFSYPRSM